MQLPHISQRLARCIYALLLSLIASCLLTLPSFAQEPLARNDTVVLAGSCLCLAIDSCQPRPRLRSTYRVYPQPTNHSTKQAGDRAVDLPACLIISPSQMAEERHTNPSFRRRRNPHRC
jgi:hypothetical protein